MSFVVAKDLTRQFDLSDPWLVRALTMRPRHVLTAVDAVSFSIEKGTTYALVGESGSGKSTIAKMAVGLLSPSSGQILVDGFNLNDRQSQGETLNTYRQKIQMVFQSPYASLNPRWRVKEILLEPILAFGLISDKSQRQRRVAELLEQVGLSPSDGDKYPHEFSGGQRQRISIARALASQPQFIVCDEPTSALDVSVQAQVLNLLKTLQKEFGLTYLFITHDLAVVSNVADRIGVLKGGKLVEENQTHRLFADPKHEYTRMLLDSAPRI